MKSNILTWIIPFVLGAFLMFAISDIRKTTAPETALISQSLTPVADKLNAYSCRVAETKKIVLGGEEDGFSLAGEEINTPGSFAEYKRIRTGSRDSIDINRGYDTGGKDSAFLETIELPSNIAHGIVVMRIRILSSLRNDAVTIGGLENGHNVSESASFAFSNPTANPGWVLDDEILSAQLDKLKFAQRYSFDKRPLPKKHDSVLDYLRDANKALNIYIADDTMIDVVGFALCLEPERGKGVTFIVDKLNDDLALLTCNTPDQKNHCSVYGGDTLCETKLPLACLADKGHALPESLKEHPAGLDDNWSASDVKFTTPIRGDALATQRDGHKHCQKTFGPEYRLANIHDGALVIGFVAYAKADGVEQAWIDSNLEPYANCWSMRSGYPEKTTDG